MRALADAGYLVAAPNHRDATCGADPAGWFDRPEQRFGRPVDWTEATFRDRADDLRALIAALRADPVLRGRIDWRRLALAGHSLGGYTVLGLAGAWPTWRIDGVQAVLALSPYTQPLVLQHRLGSLTAAVMYQGGTFDFGLTPALRGAGGAFDQTPPPKYFVEFAGAAHLAWADIGRRAHPEIVAYSLAFLDHYVRGAPAAALLTHAVPGVARLRFASDLGSGEQVAGSR
jgi:dienelactone hydrolase